MTKIKMGELRITDDGKRVEICTRMEPYENYDEYLWEDYLKVMLRSLVTKKEYGFTNLLEACIDQEWPNHRLVKVWRKS